MGSRHIALLCVVLTACSSQTPELPISIDVFPSMYNAAIAEIGTGPTIASIRNDDEMCVEMQRNQNCGFWELDGTNDFYFAIGWNADNLQIDYFAVGGAVNQDADARFVLAPVVAFFSVLSDISPREAETLLLAELVRPTLQEAPMGEFRCIEYLGARYRFWHMGPWLNFVVESVNGPELVRACRRVST